MGKVSDIIRDAWREANLIPLGAQPSSSEKAEALPRLNNLIASLFGFELGVKLRDFEIPDDLVHHAHDHGHHGHGHGHRRCPTNIRLVSSVAGNAIVDLAERPQDGARLGFVDVGMSADLSISAQSRLIEGLPNVILVPGTPPREWFYRADLGNWVRLQTLTEDDDSPFPDEFDELLSTLLAIRLMSRAGNEPRTGTAQTAQRMMTRLKTRYAQRVDSGTDPDVVHHGHHDHGHLGSLL